MPLLLWPFLAIGNEGGRIIAGIISDKIGRRLTLIIMLLFKRLSCLSQFSW